MEVCCEGSTLRSFYLHSPLYSPHVTLILLPASSLPDCSLQLSAWPDCTLLCTHFASNYRESTVVAGALASITVLSLEWQWAMLAAEGKTPTGLTPIKYNPELSHQLARS